MEKRIGTIDAPEKPDNVPNHSQWVLGQGAGCWFSIDRTEQENKYTIKRYASNGSLDCNRTFDVEENGSIFDIEKPYEFIHISHCAKCSIEQNEIIYIFNYIGE